MRTRFNLDLTSLDRFTMLIHGNYGTGKTFFLADMLKEESKKGPVRFLNIAGEDGYLSAANIGLGEVGETVDSLGDFKAALAEYAKLNLSALAIDGGKHFGRLCIRDACGDRLPKVGTGSDDWQKIHLAFESTIATLRAVAPVVVLASSSDKSMDQVAGETSLTPDMPGRQAAGVGGQFDFVFVLKAQVMGPNKIRRILQTAPVANTVIRCRLPRALPTEIELPEGGGGWLKLKGEMEKCLKPKEAK
jgi:hypothetical protein